MSITIRTVQHEDGGALHRLWQSSALYDPCTSQVFHEKIFEDEDVVPEHRLVAIIEHRMVGFGVGVVRGAPDERRGYIKLLAVSPGYRRQGVGARLLAEIEEAIIKSGAEVIRVGESAPNYLSPGIDKRNQAALDFFAQAGYQAFAEAVNQTVCLDQEFNTSDEERRLQAAGVDVGRGTIESRHPLRTLLWENWPSWIDEVDRALNQCPPAIHLAMRTTTGGEYKVLGFAAYDANNVGSAWFGPMGSDPTCRGMGIGAVLLRRCLADIRNQGHGTATIPWVGPTSFYEKTVGAKESRRFVRVEKRIKRG